MKWIEDALGAIGPIALLVIVISILIGVALFVLLTMDALGLRILNAFLGRSYRREVLGVLRAIFYPGRSSGLLQQLPDTAAAIRTHQKNGVARRAAAVDIAAAICIQLLERVTPHERKEILAEFQHTDIRKFREMARDKIKGHGKHSFPRRFGEAGTICAFALIIVNDMYERGDISKAAADAFASKVLGFLGGETFAEETMHRLRSRVDA